MKMIRSHSGLKLLTQVLVLLLLACAAAPSPSRAQQQSTQQPPPLPPLPATGPSSFAQAALDTSAVDQLLVSPLAQCRRVLTTEVLGYHPLTDIPVRQAKCTGWCLSIISQPLECRPVYSRVRVSPFPLSLSAAAGAAGPANATASRLQLDFSLRADRASALASREVDLVTSCSCRPKRCEVQLAGGSGSTFYESGATVYDACDRRCTCSYGSLVNCCRQRKDFVYGMTQTERNRFTSAVATAASTAPYKAQYDALIAQHETLFGGSIHNSAIFLPWHRYFILQLENILQQIDCRVTVPYWAWDKEAAAPMSSPLWTAANLGGNGNSSAGSCVTNGPFGPGFTVTPSGGGGCLRRAFSSGATAATTAEIYNNTVGACGAATNACYNQVRTYLEHGTGTHDHVHCIVNGHMCSVEASNDPAFFMHHNNIDRKWWDWQKQSAAHTATYSGAATNMPGTTVKPAEVLDLANQPGGVRVCFVTPRLWTWFDELVSPALVAGGLLPQLRTVSILPTTDESGAPRFPGVVFWDLVVNMVMGGQPMPREPGDTLTAEQLKAAVLARNRIGGLERERLTPTEAALGLRLTPAALRLAGGRLVVDGCQDTADTIDDGAVPDEPAECS